MSDNWSYPSIFNVCDSENSVKNPKMSKPTLAFAVEAYMSCSSDQCLCFHNTDSRTPLLSKSEISSLLSSSVTVQPALCWTWMETLKTGFLMKRLI